MTFKTPHNDANSMPKDGVSSGLSYTVDTTSNDVRIDSSDTMHRSAPQHLYTQASQHRHDHDEHLKQTLAPRDTTGYQRTLLISFVVITGYMIIEAVGGWLTGSLALLSDAGHMLSDAVALGATLAAFKIGEKQATHQKSFGYKRFEILVAMVNGATLIIIALMIAYEAIKRFNTPVDIASQGMLVIASIGMLVNIGVAWLMHSGSRADDSRDHGPNHHHDHQHGHEHKQDHLHPPTSPDKSSDTAPVNLNMHSAYLHVLSDLLGSVAAIIAALLMIGFGWLWADVVASAVVAVLILVSGYRVVRDSVHILMEGTPAGISLTDVEQSLLAHPLVDKVHDLHVWSITSGLNAMSCHVVVDGDIPISESHRLIMALEQRLLTLDIHHVTIQVESAAMLEQLSLQGSSGQGSSGQELSPHRSLQHSDALICDLSDRASPPTHGGHSH